MNTALNQTRDGIISGLKLAPSFGDFLDANRDYRGVFIPRLKPGMGLATALEHVDAEIARQKKLRDRKHWAHDLNREIAVKLLRKALVDFIAERSRRAA